MDGVDLSPAAEARRARDWGRLVADVRSVAADGIRLVAPLAQADGTLPTPCEGWTVKDVVVHLAIGDRLAAAALEGAGFDTPGGADIDAAIAAGVAAHPSRTLSEAVDAWRAEHAALIGVAGTFTTAEVFERVPWAAIPISRIALTQSRVMEAWVHGWDIARALDRARPLDDRAWWVADLGVRTLPYAITRAGMEPDLHLHLELTGIAGGTWDRRIGAGLQAARITGPAWAWIALCSQRFEWEDVAEHLDVDGTPEALSQVLTARAFV